MSAMETTCASTAAPSRAEAREVWAVNKPAGVVSTAKEPGERPAVVSLVGSEARLYPVGRLDADSTGLLLLTNDGELANRLTHPRYEVPKAYRVQLRRPPSEADLRRLARGVELEDGMTAPAEVSPARRARDRDRPARGAQPPGPPHGRGGRQQASSPCAASASARSSWATSPRARRAGSPRKRSRGSGKIRAEMAEERLFAVRGAAQAEANEADAILAATEELMRALIERNELEPEAMVSCLFTTTEDLDAEFPAVAARNIGPRLGAAALRPRDPRPRRDAAGDPRDGPLLRAARPRSRLTPTSARPRRCAPTSTPPSRRPSGTIDR